ncbi:MAG: hypothetical protein WAZ14_03420 [Patescibacteria group bacterium]
MEQPLCPCDKCRTSVTPDNDALALDLMMKKMAKYGFDFKEEELDEEGRWMNTAWLAHGSRHLLPVMDGEEVVCAGSPSRAQYIEGQPRDERGFIYDSSREVLHRAAYARIQSNTNS